MKIVDRFLNRSEQIVFDELLAVAGDNGLKAFPKSRMSDVLLQGGDHLNNRVFNYYTRAHFDFVVTDHEFRPFMVIEYDGPYHADRKQAERDSIKNELCAGAHLPLLRIGANHVTRQFRGMTLLRWIIEVSHLEIAFEEARAKGHVPPDEPFDPRFMYASTATERRWPYWLSVNASAQIMRFITSQKRGTARITLHGEDAQGNMHYLSYLRVGDDFLYVKTAARSQGAGIPVFDMLDEITICELGEELSSYLGGRKRLVSLAEFQPIHDRMCKKYNMKPGSTLGTGLDIATLNWSL